MRLIITLHRAEGILVVPEWPTQPWDSLFQKMLFVNPIDLGPSSELLSFPFSLVHPLADSPMLMAGLVSGRHISNELPESIIETMINSSAPTTLKQYQVIYKLW